MPGHRQAHIIEWGGVVQPATQHHPASMTLPPCLLSPGRALLRQILSHHITVRVLALMGTCSTCDFAGQWLHDDGIPARSGVDGGVLAWIPGRLGIATCSPTLNGFGNSVRAL